MTQIQARSVSFALALCLSTLGFTMPAHAQTTSSSKGGVTTNGVTGTDPCPKNYVCAVPPAPQAVTTPSTGSGSTTAAVLQAVAAMLGLN